MFIKGNLRFYNAFKTACFECTFGLYKDETFSKPICSIGTVPKDFNDCVVYVREILWPKLVEFESSTKYKLSEDSIEIFKFQINSEEHLKWIAKLAIKRAKEFKIDLSDVKPIKNDIYWIEIVRNVLKTIIPTLASTNSIIAGLCGIELEKLILEKNKNNFFMYNGEEGIYQNSFNLKIDENCPLCSKFRFGYNLQCDFLNDSISDLINRLKSKFGFESPTVQNEKGIVFLSSKWIKKDEEKRKKKISNVLKEGERILVSDKKAAGKLFVVDLKNK